MQSQCLECYDSRIRLGRDVDVVAPAAELANAFGEFQVSLGIEIGGQGLRRSIAAPESGEAAQEIFGTGRISARD